MTDAAESVSDEALDSILDEYEGYDTEQSSEETQTFDFGEEFQARIAALMLRDGTFLKRCSHLLKPDYFEKLSDKLLAKLATEHFDKYGSPLSDIIVLKQALIDAIRAKKIRDDEKGEVTARVKTLFRTPVDNPEYTAEKVATFARNQAIENAMMECVDLHERGNYDKMQEIMSAAFKVGQRVSGSAYNYFEENDNRAEWREQVASGAIKRRGLPIGVPQFDNLLHHRGFGIGELTVFMAAAKRGKTTAIWDIGKRWSLMGKNVLGITLEVSTQILSDRLDSNISGVPMSDLEKNISDIKNKVQLAEMKAGKFIIHEYPSNSLRPMDVEALLDDYRSQGINFDAVVVDYLDIMAPNKWIPDPIANSKDIWTNMRGIAQKFDIAMLSATQTNREGAKKATADDTDAAEDYNKIRIADLVMTINATEEELSRGESRIYFAASRNQRGKFSVLIKNNMECMQFMKTVLEIT